jgi:hypothetical protein
VRIPEQEKGWRKEKGKKRGERDEGKEKEREEG